MVPRLCPQQLALSAPLQSVLRSPGDRRYVNAALILAVAVAHSIPSVADEVVVSEAHRKLLARFNEEFVSLTPGQGRYPLEFQMGSDAANNQQPIHKVTMRPYSIAKYEVPQNLWQAVMGNNPSRWKGPRNSVEMLSFDEAQEFCERVTQMMQVAKLLAANEVIRLPSEAEWEYAARAGTSTIYSFGNEVNRLGDFAWFTDNAAGNDPPVGAKQPNAWQLFDMHGYLWEWCADPVHANYDQAPADGSVWNENGNDGQRILRGGSWKDPADRLTSSYRRFAPKHLKDDAVGLRCVKSKR